MQRHFHFWIGFFVAILLGVPIAIGAWGILNDQAAQFVAFITGLIVGLLVLLIAAVFFRDAIFKHIIGSSKHTLDDVTTSAVNTISASSRGDSDAAIESAGDLVRAGLNWYAWAGFYRWVIATCAALLVIFGAFTGTVLLFEQNRKLQAQTEQLQQQTAQFHVQNNNLSEQTKQLNAQTKQFGRQNELLTLSLVSDLRNRLGEAPRIDWAPDQKRSGTLSDSGVQCSFEENRVNELHGFPNGSTIRALVKLSNSESMGLLVQDALQTLLEDTNSTVVLGALIILDEVNAVPIDAKVTIRNAMIGKHLSLDSNFSIDFIDSAIQDFYCEKCIVSIRNSVWVDSHSPYFSASFDSLLFTNIDVFINHEATLYSSIAGHGLYHGNKGDSISSFALDVPVSVLTSLGKENSNCSDLTNICMNNPFLSCAEKL